MYLIQQLTNSPLQKQTFILYNGKILTVTFYYSNSQQGWFITNLTYEKFILNGIRIVVIPNMLNQFINQIPFGLGCFTTLLREPTQQQDFSSGNFNLYILDQTEIDEYAILLSNNAPS
jgi:hypothetical protein